MKFGRTVATLSRCPDIAKSTKTPQKKSLNEHVRHIATVSREGRYYAIEFEDGQVTQGLNRPNALVMAADLRACVDERSADYYYAKWLDDGRISVVSLPS